MIDEYYTWIFYGYHSDELSKGSHKPIIAVCDKCGKYRVSEKKSYRDLCKSCVSKNRTHSEVTKQKMRGRKAWNKGLKDSDETRKRKSEVLMRNHRSAGCTQNLSPEVRRLRSKSMLGNKHNEGKKATNETKQKMSKTALFHEVTDETRHKISLNHARYWLGKTPLKETRIKQSCTQQGINREDWDGFAKENSYCIKFNNQLKQSIRDRYNNCDYISGIHKDICNNGRSLDVHHVDYDKQQGCDDHQWKLIPLSKSNHAKTNSNRSFWNRLFTYSLQYEAEYYGDE